MEAIMQGVRDGILIDIQRRIDAEPNEERRLVHVKDREIVKHHFQVVQAPVPVPARRRRFIAFAAGGCMLTADGTV